MSRKSVKSRGRSFCLKCGSESRFQIIREYLMEKYNVYTATHENGVARFRVEY